MLERPFESFRTTKPNGLGLGLPICKKLVELHGGRLELESEPNVGTTATVILPGERVIEPALEVA